MNATPDLVLAHGRLVLPDKLVDDGWIAVTNGLISALGTGAAPNAGQRIELDGALVVPGFVDIHCHGGGGNWFFDAHPDQLLNAVMAHRRRGTTTLVASLITADIPELVDQIAPLKELVRAGEIAGIHLEGPFLSAAQCGAHDTALLRAPDSASIEKLLAAGDGTIKMMTVAPELPGGISAIRQLVDAGVLAAIGHTDATEDQLLPALDAGAGVATHLFNGMRHLHQREPGPIGTLLDDERVTVELICDLMHVHPTLIRLAARHAGPHRTALITDAMPAAGAPDGTYQLGGRDVRVSDGKAVLVENGKMAGSTLTMDAAFRNLVTQARLDLVDAVHATSTHPAKLLGIDEHTGSLAVGKSADMVVLDEQLHLHRVWRRGVGVVHA